MKKQKIITIATIILFIVIISLASFIGIYKKEEYKIINKVPKYNLGMEFTNKNIIKLEAEKQEGEENQSFTQDDYKKAEKIIKKRLRKLKVDEYVVNLDNSNGNIEVKLPMDIDIEEIEYYLLREGSFEIKDTETKETLLDYNSIKAAKVAQKQLETGAIQVDLQIKFNKEGKQKLEEITKTYIKSTEQVQNEEGETEDVDNSKTVTIYLSGQSIEEKSFEEVIKSGLLNIGVGAAYNNTSLSQYVEVAENEAIILNSGVLPISYSDTISIEEYKIEKKQSDIAIYIALAVVVVMIVTFFIKFKTKGIYAGILHIGYIALLLLALRYTTTKITITGIVGIIIGVILNFVYLYIAFKNSNLNFIKEVTAKYALKLIPVYIIAIPLCFVTLANVYSLGMTLFWSVAVMYIYNLTLTQITLKTIKE